MVSPYWDTHRIKIWSDLIGFDSLILSLSLSLCFFIFSTFFSTFILLGKLYKLNDTVILFTMYCVKLSMSIVLMASISVSKNHSIEKLASIVFHWLYIVWVVIWLSFVSFWPLASFTRSRHHSYLHSLAHI